jgi:hypothetical protein
MSIHKYDRPIVLERFRRQRMAVGQCGDHVLGIMEQRVGIVHRIPLGIELGRRRHLPAGQVVEIGVVVADQVGQRLGIGGIVCCGKIGRRRRSGQGEQACDR